MKFLSIPWSVFKSCIFNCASRPPLQECVGSCKYKVLLLLTSGTFFFLQDFWNGKKSCHLHKKHSQELELCAGTSFSWYCLQHQRDERYNPKMKPEGTGLCWGWTWPQICCPLAPDSVYIHLSPSSAKEKKIGHLKHLRPCN